MGFKLCFLTLFCLSFESLYADDYLNNLHALSRKSTVYYEVTFTDPSNSENVCTKKSQGTGFIISDRGHVLTAYHPFKIPDDCTAFTKLSVMGKIGYRESARWLEMKQATQPDKFSDTTLFIFPEREKTYVNTDLCIDNKISPASKLYSFGFPLGEGFRHVPVAFAGRGLDKDRWGAVSVFTHGMSGGPVYNNNYEVVAIVQGGKKNAPAVRYMIPIRLAASHILSAGVELKSCENKALNAKRPSPSQNIKTYEDRLKFIETAAKNVGVSPDEAAINIAPDKSFFGKNLKLLGYTSYEGANVDQEYWCSTPSDCELPGSSEYHVAPVENSSSSRSGSKSINFMPKLLPAKGYRTVSRNRFRRLYDVKGFDKIHLHMWIKSNTNKDFDDFISCHSSNTCNERISNCDSALEVYFRLNRDDWKHWMSLCGQQRKEEQWRKIKLERVLDKDYTFEVAFKMTIQNPEKEMINRRYLVDDILLFAEK